MMHSEGKSIRWIVEKTTVGLPYDAIETLEQELDAFVFFHLGSDAEIEIRQTRSGLSFSFRHQRINPFNFELSNHKIHSLIRNPEYLESLLLDQLNRNRRS
jgi:hypothetical protein